MIFIWGTKERRKASGYVADVCSSCKAINVHRLIEVREVPHVYYLSIGGGKVAFYQVECDQCDAVETIHPSRYTARLDKAIEVDKLIELTHPGVHAELEEQKQREERAERGELTAEERIQVMQEALYPVAVAVEERSAKGAIDLQTGLACLATLILPWFLVLPGTAEQSVWGDLLVYAGIGVALLGVIATVYAYRTSLKRFVRRSQGDAIQAAIREYHPSPTELNDITAGLRDAGTALGKSMDVAWLTDLFYSSGAVSAKPIG
jgi:hypothetical protein